MWNEATEEKYRPNEIQEELKEAVMVAVAAEHIWFEELVL